ncbi:transcriptional regulator, Nlp family [Devosia enhydra]|uniref:Transcriptional regulator, Nlp family n=1 Tax=Devosia enhydra TaxID=665118 RepID=A0A1K2I0P8_9HYPH|nr:helix-turn-helix domain-containing protein [Devosia enhydra]SFZ85962.1 transcriptional regulator, Nlp family [Devosia enhydra]
MTKTQAVVWDRHAIKAEIGRKGLTQTAIAQAAGLEPSAVRHGLRGGNRKGAEAIAKALGLPFRTLFPDSYLRGLSNESDFSLKAPRSTSQKRHIRDDARSARR